MASNDSTAPRESLPAKSDKENDEGLPSSNQSTASTQATVSDQNNSSIEDVERRNRETVRLYGFETHATGDDLSRVVASVLKNQRLPFYAPGRSDTTFRPFYFFFYGSLQDPRILSSVCGMGSDEPELKAGTIEGWETMLWSIYPALVPKAGNVVKGMYWQCQNPRYVHNLCRYEGRAYRMEFCKIVTDQGEVIEDGRTFVSTSDKSELREGVFDLKEFMDGR
ncbi:hypothetical protein F5Y05DRAFT_407366 [Hypoxylon sp. FL0543]|nr:hypothetical protein F5Y05DRAFT_407366 [Hypoxylon sp. FL0543]